MLQIYQRLKMVMANLGICGKQSVLKLNMEKYGNPDAFCSNVEATNWMSATVATSNEIIEHIMNVCKRHPRAGKVTTGVLLPLKIAQITGIFLDNQPSTTIQISR